MFFLFSGELFPGCYKRDGNGFYPGGFWFWAGIRPFVFTGRRKKSASSRPCAAVGREVSLSSKIDAILKKPWVVALLAILCCVLWGSASPCIKIGYELLSIPSDSSGTQVLFAGLRFTLAGVLALLFGSILQRRPLLPRKSAVGKILKLSVFQTSLQYFCLYVGLAHTTGVNGSIIIGTNTLITILIAALLFRQEKLTLPKLVGCIVGLMGVLAANLGSGGFHFHFSLAGEGMVMVAMLSYALSSCFLKRYSQSEDPVMLSGYQFIVGGITLLAVGFLMGGRLDTFNLPGVLMLLYLALVSAVAYSLWGMLLKVNPVSKVSIYGFMNPVVGVLLSALLLGEGGQAFQFNNILALLLVSLGIFIVNRFHEERSHKALSSQPDGTSSQKN